MGGVNMIYDFGMRLQVSRKNKKLTQSQVAELIGTTKSSISGYENNTSFPPIEILKRMALIYGVSCDYLLGIDERHTIIVEDITENQYSIIRDTVNKFVSEFKYLNKLVRK